VRELVRDKEELKKLRIRGEQRKTALKD